VRTTPPTTPTTAVVTGAGRGLGRAVAAALVAAGTAVVGIARSRDDLAAAADELGTGFTALPADATDPDLARDVLRRHRPDLLVLNAGVAPHVAPVHEQSWEEFSRTWHVDTRHAFAWTRAALREPLAPGSRVVAVSSGAALSGSPLSGGYAGAKAAVRYLSRYADDEARRAGLGVRFVALLPGMTPAGGVGEAGVVGYAARQGVDRDSFVAAMQPVLTGRQVGEAVLALAADPDPDPDYRLDGAGLHRIG
jgi:NAD(P)-dependent dehydrogenase (short-subunit alcohol dehydrogenase family)